MSTEGPPDLAHSQSIVQSLECIHATYILEEQNVAAVFAFTENIHRALNGLTVLN